MTLALGAIVATGSLTLFFWEKRTNYPIIPLEQTYVPLEKIARREQV